MFKNQVDELVPGFARWADTAADLFVDRAGYPRPVPGSRQEQSRPSGWSGARLGDTGKKTGDPKTDSNTSRAAKKSSEVKTDPTESNLTEKKSATNHDKEVCTDVQFVFHCLYL